MKSVLCCALFGAMVLSGGAFAQENSEPAKDAEAVADAMFAPGGAIEEATAEGQADIDEQNAAHEEDVNAQSAATTPSVADENFTIPEVSNDVLSEWLEGYYAECLESDDAKHTAQWCQCAATEFSKNANAGAYDVLARVEYNRTRRVEAAFLYPRECD
ncbi:MAG: hypothetical protein MRY64_13300 [Hyphomonadaceae bacterium]|nr:hypothetical protein [Hyphomonadaceae bacterium]